MVLNPALEVGDSIEITYGTDGTAQTHVIDTLTLPLGPTLRSPRLPERSDSSKRGGARVDLGLLLGDIAQSSGDGIAFHTGVITSWDEQTGNNTVTVSGANMRDSPVLSPSPTLGLRAGLTVGCFGSDSLLHSR